MPKETMTPKERHLAVLPHKLPARIPPEIAGSFKVVER